MVVIDSKYADLTEEKGELQYKIYGKMFNADEKDVGKQVKEKLKDFMKVDSFKNTNELSDKVKELISNINNKLSNDKKISEIIPECFGELFNNKVGKLISKLEKESLNIFNKPTYIDGSLMIRQRRFDEYEWVIYLGEKNSKREIIVKDTNNFIKKEVFSSSLFSYPEAILPDDITIIETYIFD
jgi:hypothetical protein